MSAVWPGSLPYAQFLGLARRRKPAIVETQMSVGAPKARAIQSAALEEHDVPIVLDGQQMQDFDSWFETDLQNGALPFTWTHPVTDRETVFAFRAEDVRFQLSEGGGASAGRLWSGTLPLRVVPS